MNARRALVGVLAARGFTQRGQVFVREASAITQAVAVVRSRFGAGHVWIEVVLVLGQGPARARQLAAYQRAPNTIASLRLDEIAPQLPPYLDGDAAIDALEAVLVEHLVPFLDQTRTTAGVDRALAELGEGRVLARAVMHAKLGDPSRSRALFAAAPGDREAVARLAASLGVELDGA